MYKIILACVFCVSAVSLFGQQSLDGVYENESAQIQICIKGDSIFYLRQSNEVDEYYYGSFYIQNNTFVFNHNCAYNHNTIIDTRIGKSRGMEIELIELQREILLGGEYVDKNPYEVRSSLWGIIINDKHKTINDSIAIFYPNDFKLHEKEVELIVTGGMMSGYLDIVKLPVVFGRRYVLKQCDTKWPLLEGSYPLIKVKPNCYKKIRCYDNKTGKLIKMKRIRDCISCSNEMIISLSNK